MTATETLRELILQRKGDRSYARMSADGGGKPTAGRIQQIAEGEIKNFPDPASIVGLTRSLPATPTEIVLAAARQLGLAVTDGFEIEGLVITGAPHVPEPSRTALETIARQLSTLAATNSPPPKPDLSDVQRDVWEVLGDNPQLSPARDTNSRDGDRRRA